MSSPRPASKWAVPATPPAAGSSRPPPVCVARRLPVRVQEGLHAIAAGGDAGPLCRACRAWPLPASCTEDANDCAGGGAPRTPPFLPAGPPQGAAGFPVLAYQVTAQSLPPPAPARTVCRCRLPPRQPQWQPALTPLQRWGHTLGRCGQPARAAPAVWWSKNPQGRCQTLAASPGARWTRICDGSHAR